MFKRLQHTANLLKIRALRLYHYCSTGVWTDMRPKFSVRFVKTLNLSVKAFFNSDIQTKACALTYRTFLALVPALALIFAIGKGFGLQDYLQRELIAALPSQVELLNQAFEFVDSYLNQSSEGVLVGFGIALLLWTLISILGAVEDSFNNIWGVKAGRSIWRKATDYLAIFMVLPVLLICAGGFSALVTTSLHSIIPAGILSPMVDFLLEVASVVVVWLFFTIVYIMVPNTKVKFKNALVAGIFAGTAFVVLQWLFITGQVYVSKYNAIYGSFAFLPLFLIWMQLVWVVTLAGAIICYASQNIYRYNFSRETDNISPQYRLKFSVAVLTIIVDEYVNRHHTPTIDEITDHYDLPNRLVSNTIHHLVDMGLLLRVLRDSKEETIGYAPAIEPSALTLGNVVSRYRNKGASGFIPGFGKRFAPIVEALDNATNTDEEMLNRIYIKDLQIELPHKNSAAT